MLANTTSEISAFNFNYLKQQLIKCVLDFYPAMLIFELNDRPFLQIGEQFVGEDGCAESRSQTKLLREAERESGSANTGRAPLKRAGTMDVTKAVNK